MNRTIQIGSKVVYTGPTIEQPWLPRGAEGVVIYIDHGMPFPFICNFNVPDGEDWPMSSHDLEVI